jgi:hypothetical protein
MGCKPNTDAMTCTHGFSDVALGLRTRRIRRGGRRIGFGPAIVNWGNVVSVGAIYWMLRYPIHCGCRLVHAIILVGFEVFACREIIWLLVCSARLHHFLGGHVVQGGEAQLLTQIGLVNCHLVWLDSRLVEHVRCKQTCAKFCHHLGASSPQVHHTWTELHWKALPYLLPLSRRFQPKFFSPRKTLTLPGLVALHVTLPAVCYTAKLLSTTNAIYLFSPDSEAFCKQPGTSCLPSTLRAARQNVVSSDGGTLGACRVSAKANVSLLY